LGKTDGKEVMKVGERKADKDSTNEKARYEKTWESHYFTYLKEILHDITTTRLPNYLNLAYDKESCFTIRMEFLHSEAEEKDKERLKELFTQITKGHFGEEILSRKKVGKKKQKNPFSRQTINMVLKRVQPSQLSEFKFLPPPPTHGGVELRCLLSHLPVYVQGRYLKLIRGISQTPWLLGNGERKSETSVQEEVGKVLEPGFKATGSKFHSGGREDTDVLMLGNGRPFVFELLSPHYIRDQEAVKAFGEKINTTQKYIKVLGLSICPNGRKDVAGLAVAAQEKRKAYRAKVHLTKGFTQKEIEQRLSRHVNLSVKQKTPIRVLHRRTAMIRPKVIHSLRLFKWLGPKCFILDLITEAGTYVKEFVHGDRGRTVPNLGVILDCDADISQLDVMGLIEE